MSIIRAIGDNVVIHRLGRRNRTKSGIYIVGYDKPQLGWIVSGGESLGLAEGDFVIFRKYAGYNVNIGEKEFLILHKDDILAVADFKMRDDEND